MAGIGLRLHRVVAGGTYLQAATAYLSSAIITAGPWLSAVFWLGLLGSAAIAFMSQADRDLLIATITYAFCASLLVTGGPQLIVTRYLADRLYVEDREAIAPTCTGVTLLAFPILILALPFLILAPFDIRYRLLATSLFITVSLIWMIVVFLSATRDYVRIVLVFLSSYALSVLAALGLGRPFGLLGSLGGFTLGQLVCLCLLIAHVYLEFPPAPTFSLAFLGHGRRYWDLLLLGLCSAVGLWIDNILFWFSGNGVAIAHFYRVFPAYDVAKLIGYLSTIPAGAVFFVQLETTFYIHYQRFYRLILEKGVLADIVMARRGMQWAARSAVLTILKIQGIAAMLILLLAPDLARLLGVPASRVPMLRLLAVGTSSQFVLMVSLLLLLYLDARRPALKVALVFACSSASLTLLTLHLGTPFYGSGYTVAAALSALLALAALHDRLKRLEYLTFMLQPMHPEG